MVMIHDRLICLETLRLLHTRTGKGRLAFLGLGNFF